MSMNILKTLQLCLLARSRRITKVIVMICVAGSLFTGALLPFTTGLTKLRAQETARLIRRYERSASQNRVVEDTIEIRLVPEETKRRMVAIRVCSTQPLPFVLFRAAIDPFATAKYLEEFYAYAPDKIFLLRSEECRPLQQSEVESAEIWIASTEESLPSSVESLRFDQITLSALGAQPVNRGVRDYQAAAETLIQTLRTNPDSKGVIIGYYLDHPNPMLRKRIQGVERLLKKSGVPAKSYYVLLTKWHEGESSYPNSEPSYPAVFALQTINGTARK